jgi:hypothetical protein
MDADVIVVGAGLSGLVAANGLEDAGYSVIVVDKGRSVGGRMATRRIQNGIAANIMTMRSVKFSILCVKNYRSIWGKVPPLKKND